MPCCELKIGDSIWNLFTHFFRTEKGYEKWTDEQIELSYNNDDVCEFVEWLSREETKQPKTFTIIDMEELQNEID